MNSQWPVKVSVLMITYNQERYIAQAIESALKQETSFDYEIVIGEDHSTDGTREIVAELARNHPGKIKTLLAPSNQGGHRNFCETWKACRGQYIAILEGDDFWTSAAKLQRQADFLDQHPECSLCFHRVTVLHPDGSRSEFPEAAKERSNIEDILMGNFISTPSTMVRNGLVKEPPAWIQQLRMADWPMWVLHAVHGQLGYIDEVMAAYRMHSGGVWSLVPYAQRLVNGIPFYRNMDAALNFRYHGLISERLYDTFSHLVRTCWEAGEYAQARRYAGECFRVLPFGRHLPDKAQLLARVLWPAGYRAGREVWRWMGGRTSPRELKAGTGSTG